MRGRGSVWRTEWSGEREIVGRERESVREREREREGERERFASVSVASSPA